MTEPRTLMRGVGWLPTLKVLPLAMTYAGPKVPYSLETVQDRSYPIADEIYASFDRDPAKPINPLVYEFVKFIVSREGQEAVMRDAKYLPLTAKVSTQQTRRLEEIAQ